MKKFMIILIVLAFMAGTTFGDTLTYGPDYYRGHLGQLLSGSTSSDPLYLFINEVDGTLAGTTSVPAIYFEPTVTGSAPTATEGTMWYDTSTGTMKYRNNDSSWISLTGLEAGAAGTLDDSYNSGRVIDVDEGAVTLTTTASSDCVALTITHGETGNFSGLVVTNASAFPGIQITTANAGADITGTGASWTIDKDGAITCVGITNTGTVNHDSADVFFDATESSHDLEWDDDKYMLHFLDDCILGLGGSTGAVGDITFTNDGTNLIIEAASEDNTPLLIGNTHAVDWIWYGNTNTDIFMLDSGAGMLVLDSYPISLGDGDPILFGDALGTGYFSIAEASNVLVINNISDGAGTVSFGVSGAGIDVLFYGDAGSGLMTWDENQNTNGALVFDNADIELGDDDFIQFGDEPDWYITSGTAKTLDIIPGILTDSTAVVNIGADGAGADLVLFGEQASHTVWWDASLDTWYFGVNSDGTDIYIYGDSPSNNALFDTSNDELYLTHYDIQFNDDADLILGTDNDFVIESKTQYTLDILGSQSNESNVVNIGVDQSGADFNLFGTGSGDSLKWDAGDDSLIMVGDIVLFTLAEAASADVFKVSCTGASGGADVIVLETTDGGILLDANDGTNGDIEINAEDNITITAAGNTTITTTGTLTLASGTTNLGDNQLRRTVTAIAANDMDQLAATQIELVASPGASAYIEFVSAIFALDWNSTAWTEADAPDDLVIRYTDGTGGIVSELLDATGFALAENDYITAIGPVSDIQAGTTAKIGLLKTACVDQPLVLDNTGIEWTGSGNSPVVVIVYYRIHTLTELGLDA